MKIRYYILPLILIFSSFIVKQDCLENIDLLPMYGKVKKCDKQIKEDEEFINSSLKIYKSRAKAAEKSKDEAWNSFEKNDLNGAMKKFNRTWLLDSLNFNSLLGFWKHFGKTKKIHRSNKLL